VEVQDAPLRRSVVEEIDQDLEATEAEEPAPPARLENDYKIAIERFVPRSQIDPAYFEKAYYIVPRELVGQEAFAVVRDAMGEKGMVALGHVILSTRRRPVAIEAHGRGMRGFLLRHLHEVRSEAEYFAEIPHLELPREMLQLAKSILEAKTGDFDPAFLEDRYQQALVSTLRKKHVETSAKPAGL
jgi:DNA end-binding protein Ku